MLTTSLPALEQRLEACFLELEKTHRTRPVSPPCTITPNLLPVTGLRNMWVTAVTEVVATTIVVVMAVMMTNRPLLNSTPKNSQK